MPRFSASIGLRRVANSLLSPLAGIRSPPETALLAEAAPLAFEAEAIAHRLLLGRAAGRAVAVICGRAGRGT